MTSLTKLIGQLIQPASTDRANDGPGYAVEVYEPDLGEWVCASDGEELTRSEAEDLADKIISYDPGVGVLGGTVSSDEIRVVPVAESEANLDWWSGSRTSAICTGRAGSV